MKKNIYYAIKEAHRNSKNKILNAKSKKNWNIYGLLILKISIILLSTYM
jgi:hypothetical protein